jgi:hypothetical protein
MYNFLTVDYFFILGSGMADGIRLKKLYEKVPRPERTPVSISISGTQ